VSDAAALAPGDEVGLPVHGAHLDELRRARRRRRVAEIHWVDALYRVYVAALIGAIAVALAAGAVGDTPLRAAQVADVTRNGAGVIGLVATLGAAIGLRSGSRGGPLAVEAADVRHVLLAPVDRGRVLRGPALRQVRSALFVAFLAGATLGAFADRRFPEPAPAWIAAGAVAVVTTVALSLGLALVASGRRLSRPAATAVGGLALAWSVADIAGSAVAGVEVPASPGRAVGWLALAPLDLHLVSIAAVAAAAALVALGVAGVGGVSVEEAERRTALVGQIRFAATLQDVRTVLVLRRQLAAERPRRRPWLRLGPGRGNRPAWRRTWRGVLRFPASRLARLLLLAIAGGAALRGAWSGTAPLVAVSGLALWMAGLDVVEPLAQEIDHPGRSRLYPGDEGQLHLGLLGASVVVATALGLVAASVAVAPGAGRVPLAVGLVAGVVTAVAGVAGAVCSVVAGAPAHSDSLSLIAPEVAGTRLILRAAWPPALAVLGSVPLLLAEADVEAGQPPFARAAAGWFAVATVVALVAGWVQRRQAIAQWWAEAMQANASAGSTDDADPTEADDEDEDDDDDEQEGPEEGRR